jgi:hypothetical protein
MIVLRVNVLIHLYYYGDDPNENEVVLHYNLHFVEQYVLIYNDY